MIAYRTDLRGVDWDAFRQDLIADDFHNGRTTGQLRLSFANSTHVAMAFADERCVGSGRLLSDGVGNAYVVDVWTQSAYRGQGVASRLMTMLTAAVPGQHIYLQTDTAVGFYQKLGYRRQPEGMSFIAGTYLDNASRDD